MKLITTEQDLYTELIRAGLPALLYTDPDSLDPEYTGKYCYVLDKTSVHDAMDVLESAGLSKDRQTFLLPKTYNNDIDELLGLSFFELTEECFTYWDMLAPELKSARIEEKDRTRIPCGIPGFEEKIRYASKEVITLAGGYGTGKSTFCTLMGIDAAQRAPEGVLGAGLEDHPVAIQSMIASYLRARYPDDDEYEEILNTVLQRFRYLDRSKFKMGGLTIEKWVEVARSFHEEYGIKFFTVDPWSAMMHRSGSGYKSETEYVAHQLNMVNHFASSTGSVVVIVSHVPKGRISEDGKPIRMSGADAMGSIHFGNLSDRTLVFQTTNYWRDEDEIRMGHTAHTIIHQDKIKVAYPLQDIHGGEIPSMGKRGPAVYEFNSRSLEYDEVPHLTREAINLWAGRELQSPEDLRYKGPLTGNFQRDILGVT